MCNENMAKTPKTAKTVKVQEMKPFTGKTRPGDNKPGLEPPIKFYKVDGYYETEQGEKLNSQPKHTQAMDSLKLTL